MAPSGGIWGRTALAGKPNVLTSPRNVCRLAGPSDPVSPAGKLSQRAAQFGICVSLLPSAGHSAGGSRAQTIPHGVRGGELPLRAVNVC